ncbi:hypothetical protein PR048_020842 [Dryococelus australis]|uniref:Uncharacterized protein n=1 Tax=Dryococelus australis TaxID=614101 RepID=A0ABQ9GWJ5_9NEOP|nr:hypothetical protein PR048_020842 [Dryococelus australis]
MDGPAVNWKLFNVLQADFKKYLSCTLIDVGSCTLHILKNCFKHSNRSTLRDLEGFLASIYWLFIDSPARREDYLNISLTKKLPTKFCKHTPERPLERWGDLKKCIKEVGKENL